MVVAVVLVAVPRLSNRALWYTGLSIIFVPTALIFRIHLRLVPADEMLKRGVYVIGFSFPVVPKGLARIRTQISAAHSEADIDKAVAAFIEVGKLKGVIQ